MAKAQFVMRYGGSFTGTSKKTGKEYTSISFLEEVETRDGDVYVKLTSCFVDTRPSLLNELRLYDPLNVIFDVSSDGKNIKFVSMTRYEYPEGGAQCLPS